MAPISLAVSAVLLLVLVQTWRVVYRLLFHPLASVPGTKLAAATTLWQFYWDAVRGGKMVFRLEEMHQKYGIHQTQPRFHTASYYLSRPYHSHRPQ